MRPAEQLLKRQLMRLLIGALAALATGPLAAAGLQDTFIRAADAGECIENVTYRMIKARGAASAEPIVVAALAALKRKTAQQRALGCQGEIAAQAIAAGADPAKVLAATAAGL